MEWSVEFSETFNPLLERAISGYQGMARSTSINDTYRKTINKFAGRAMTDDEHLNLPSAMRSAIRELTEQGIKTIDYKSGHTSRMDSAVRNAMTTEFTQIVQEVQRKLGEEIGTDGWEISAHQHCAVDHEPLQGHTFTNEEFDKLQNGDVAEDIEGEAFQIDRPIGKWNCRHIAFPVIIGVSEPSFSPEELEEIKERNEEGVEYQGEHYTLYEAEQEQRRIETQMRQEKERLELLKELKDTDPLIQAEYNRSRRRLAELRGEYKELGAALEPMAIRMKADRASVPSSLRSMATGKVVDDLQRVTHIGSVGIPDVNNEVSKGIYGSIKDVYDRYPILDGKITSIGQNEHGKNTLASIYENTGELNLNIEFFGKTDEGMKKDYEKWVEEGKFPKGTTWQSVINHEIGHLVDRYITLIERQNLDRDYILRTNFSTELRRTVMKELGVKQENYGQYIYNGLSLYATESASEFLAEAFSEFTTSPNPRIIARTVGRIIERYLKGEINYGGNR